VTGLRARILDAAAAGERWIDRRRARRRRGLPVLEPYRGFATPDRLILRGRVLSALRRTTPSPEASRWQNLRQMAGLFLTDEVSGVTVVAPEAGGRATSDAEGYLWLELPRAGLAPGWHMIPVEIEGHPATRTDFPLLLPAADARFAVVSDIDDTLIETGAYSLARNLWTTFTGSALTRQVHPDSVVLIDYLSAHGRNPVYYVSSSPWNLHYFLERVFRRAGLVAGPMFLRDFGLNGGGMAGGHLGHKGAAIARLLDAHPGLPFVLVGDTGQKDAQVYLEMARRDGARIAAVILRQPGPGPAADARGAIAALRKLGVPVFTGPTLAEVPAELARAGVTV
jgi:phosphatidate phosphatase APP1